MKRTLHATLALSALIATVACSGTNDPATETTTTGDGDGAVVGDGDGEATGTGGTPGAGTGGTPGGDGDVPSTGGTVGGDGDVTGTGGTGGTPATGTLGSPVCGVTLAGVEAKKDVACTAEDVQLCYRTCGPTGVGWKSETCLGGIYDEGDCQFPPESTYECFAIPATVDATCPTTVETMPQAGEACDVAECTTCNVNGQYMTTGAEVKVGYCVCQAANGAGLRSWSCASDTAWPCPLGNGC